MIESFDTNRLFLPFSDGCITKAFHTLVKSIDEKGLIQPIEIVRVGTNAVIAHGVSRYFAHKALKLPKIDCCVIDLDPIQIAEYRSLMSRYHYDIVKTLQILKEYAINL